MMMYIIYPSSLYLAGMSRKILDMQNTYHTKYYTTREMQEKVAEMCFFLINSLTKLETN